MSTTALVPHGRFLAVAAPLLLATACGFSATIELRGAVKARVDAEYPSLESIYKNLHAHPELSFIEVKTAAVVAEEWRRLGFEVTEKVGNPGVAGLLKNGVGPTVLVRGDMNALPVKETSGVPAPIW